MGMGTNLLVIFFCVNVGLWLVGGRSLITTFFETDEDTGEVSLSLANLITANAISMAVVAVAVAAGWIVSGPSPWLIFLAISAYFVSLAVMPLTFLTDPTMPFIIKLMIGGGLSLIFTLAVLSWYRGWEL